MLKTADVSVGRRTPSGGSGKLYEHACTGRINGYHRDDDEDQAVPPLLCLLYAEFDAHAGPRIVFQVPDNVEVITKEMFDSLSAFIIPKADLVDRLIKVDMSKLKIMGYSKAIESGRYERNALIFNLCFVVPNLSEVDYVYEPVVEKLANSLEAFELECSFLSDEKNRTRMRRCMLDVFRQLNQSGKASLYVNDKCQVQLKMLSFQSYPLRTVSPAMAPALRRPLDTLDTLRCDIVWQKVAPHIDGFATVAKIAAVSGVDLGIVMRCIKDTVYDRLICLHPVFQYSGLYAVTCHVRTLYKSHADFRRKFCRDVALHPGTVPSFANVFRLLNSIRPDEPVRDWYLRTRPRALAVDERRLIQTAVCQGWLRKICGYPVLVNDRRAKLPSMLFRLRADDFDGTKTLEDLAIKAQLAVGYMYRLLAESRCTTIVWK